MPSIRRRDATVVIMKYKVIPFFLGVTLVSALVGPGNKPPFVNISSKLEATTTSPDIMSFLLTQEKVENAIDHACQEKNANAARLAELCALRVERITDWQQLADDGYDEEFNANDYLKNKTPWHFGLSIRNQENTEVIGIVSFYVAYSSWSGRILYVDRLQCDGLSDDMEESLLRILADVALKLDCARLTWRHTTTPEWHVSGSNTPEMHAEVLTLSMNEEAMANFISDSSLKDIAPVEGRFSKDLVNAAFDACLEKTNCNPSSKFRLRLARQEDLGTIASLVQGLADYVKEPDSVDMTAEDYLKDGFSLDDPLWYCLLIDKVNPDGSVYTCGYAFIFVGYVFGQGRFIYLEDLYLEVKHRGAGGGKTTMKTLAALCRAMRCSHLYWQALDWNTAGLSFYEKIGARVHLGEKTSRYAGERLKMFAEKGTN